jgi:hypothetical protein
MHHPMQTQDGFDPIHPLPQFLADPPERGIRNASDGAVGTSRALRAGIVIAAATATGFAVLAMGNPMGLLAEMSASLVGNSTPQPRPEIQSAADAPALVPSTADAQALPPTTNDAPARAEIAVSEPASQDQTEKTESSETLFKQFQAWAAEQDAQAHGGPVQPVQDTPAQIMQEEVQAPSAKNVRTPYPQVQKRRQVRTVQNARAEVRTQNLRRQVRRAQTPRAERPPIQDARAQDQSAQNAQAPSFLPPIFGQRN